MTNTCQPRWKTWVFVLCSDKLRGVVARCCKVGVSGVIISSAGWIYSAQANHTFTVQLNLWPSYGNESYKTQSQGIEWEASLHAPLLSSRHPHKHGWSEMLISLIPTTHHNASLQNNATTDTDLLRPHVDGSLGDTNRKLQIFQNKVLSIAAGAPGSSQLNEELERYLMSTSSRPHPYLARLTISPAAHYYSTGTVTENRKLKNRLPQDL